jgi:anti-sigma B factor antagonist
MADHSYPVVMIGGVPVVEAPPEIDLSNAERFRAALMRAASGRHRAVVVVNMAGTRFCDSSGLHALADAHNRATAEKYELLLIMPASDIVLRVLTLTGLDQRIRGFTNLNEALAWADTVIPRPLQPPATP